MSAVHTKIFMSNKSQAVRLPRAVAFPDDLREVDIIAIGNKRIIAPSGEGWDEWFESPRITDDFMQSREQPADQQRESI